MKLKQVSACLLLVLSLSYLGHKALTTKIDRDRDWETEISSDPAIIPDSIIEQEAFDIIKKASIVGTDTFIREEAERISAGLNLKLFPVSRTVVDSLLAVNIDLSKEYELLKRDRNRLINMDNTARYSDLASLLDDNYKPSWEDQRYYRNLMDSINSLNSKSMNLLYAD